MTVEFGGGGVLEEITDITLTDTFLDPCQTMSCSVGADETRFDILGSVRPGDAFTVRVNGNPQCTGIVDSVSLTASHGEGRRVSITGRDMLSQVVDSNADPRIAISAGMPMDEFCQRAFEHFGLSNITIFEEADRGRSLTVGRAIKTKKGAAKRRKKFKDPVDGIRPKDNEGGWQWISRILHRLGYHAWAMPSDEGPAIVVGTPDYEQEPCFKLVSKRSQGLQGLGAANNILSASARLDITSLCSHVYVRGKGSKKGEAKSYIGSATNPKAPVFKAFFVCDEDGATQAHCDAYARLILSRAQRTAQTYEVTVAGLADPETGSVYNVDTVAMIDDENCGVKGPMWIEARTMRQSKTTNETQLKFIPPDALLMDFYVSDSLPPSLAYDEAKKNVKPMKGADLTPSDIFTSGWLDISKRAKAERGR